MFIAIETITTDDGRFIYNKDISRKLIKTIIEESTNIEKFED